MGTLAAVCRSSGHPGDIPRSHFAPAPPCPSAGTLGSKGTISTGTTSVTGTLQTPSPGTDQSADPLHEQHMGLPSRSKIRYVTAPELPKASVRIGPSGYSLRYGLPNHGATSSSVRASA